MHVCVCICVCGDSERVSPYVFSCPRGLPAAGGAICFCAKGITFHEKQESPIQPLTLALNNGAIGMQPHSW